MRPIDGNKILVGRHSHSIPIEDLDVEVGGHPREDVALELLVPRRSQSPAVKGKPVSTVCALPSTKGEAHFFLVSDLKTFSELRWNTAYGSD